jgi:pimeloyl-ACP methyl ester carboxylesterase
MTARRRDAVAARPGVSHPRAVARAIVYIHGLGESGVCFDPLVGDPALRGFRHVVIDLPGYGRAAWPAEPASLAELAEWVAARLEPDAILVGHSMGGVIGVELCERHPGAIGGFANIEGNVTPGDCTASAVAAAQPIDDFVARGFDRLRDDTYEQGATDRAKRGYFASMRFADPRSFHRHAAELVRVSADESMAARLAAIAARTPFVYVAGVPGGAAARTLELLAERAIPTVRVEPAGHWPFVDQPGAVADALLRLADGVGSLRMNGSI